MCDSIFGTETSYTTVVINLSRIAPNRLLELSPAERKVLIDCCEIAEEAENAFKLLQKYPLFRMGETKIEVWHAPNGKDYEYLTNEGVWEVNCFSEIHYVRCTVKDIYQHLLADYLVKNGHVIEKGSTGKYTDNGKKAFIAKRFRTFIQRIRDKYEPEENVE